MSNELDLPAILEECAEHIRAGRDPSTLYEVYQGLGWREAWHTKDIVEHARSRRVRRKPQTITINGVEVPKPSLVGGECTTLERGFTTELNIELTFSVPVSLESAEEIIKALRGEQ